MNSIILKSWMTLLDQLHCFLVERYVTTSRTNPTTHDIEIDIFIQVPNKEVLSYFVIRSSETLMRIQKT